MIPSQDEVWEWAIELSEKYGYHPMRVIGMLDTYSWDGYEKGMKRVEKKIKEESSKEA